MSTQDIAKKLRELKELQRLAEEVETEIENIKDAIRGHMDAHGIEELAAGEYKVRYTSAETSRLDAAALRRAMPELCEMFTKRTKSRRFTVV